MKKIRLKHTLLLLTASSIVPFMSAYAADNSGSWEFNIGAFYAQADTQNSPYLTVINHQDPDASSDTISYNNVTPKYNFGYQVGLGYLFNSKQDIQFNWTHFNSDSTSSTYVEGSTLSNNTPGATFTTLSGQAANLWAGDSMNASEKATFKYDAIDSTFGQNINIGPRFQARLFGGIRAAQINSDLVGNYDSIQDAGYHMVETDTLNSSFKGIGPQLGLSANYNIVSCLKMTTQVAGVALVGDSKTSMAAERVFYDTKPVNYYTSYDSGIHVVPGYDLKMGLSCGIPLSSESKISLEAGYNITQYIGAMAQFPDNTQTSNATISGPYMNLNYSF